MVAPRDMNGRRLDSYGKSRKELDAVEEFDGVTDVRECTDIFCLILFIVFLVGMAGVGIAGYTLGNPRRLTYGTDSWGNSCGAVNAKSGGTVEGLNNVDMTGKDYLWFGNPFNPGEIEICVEKCPDKTPDIAELLNISVSLDDFDSSDYGNVSDKFTVEKSLVECPPDFKGKVSFGDLSLPNPFVDKGDLYNVDRPCYFRYTTSDVLRRCIPSPGNDFLNSTFSTAESMAEVNTADIAASLLADVNEAKWQILACCLIAVLFAFLWLVFLRYFATLMVWVTIIVFVLVCAGITLFLLLQAKDAKETYDQAVKDDVATDRMQYNYYTLLVLGIIAAVILLVVIVALIFMRNNISIATHIIEEAAQAMKSMPTIIFFPVGLFLVMGLFFAYWVSAWLFLGTAGAPDFDDDGRLLDYSVSRDVRTLQLYHVFGLLWVVQFLLGVGECVIAGAIASWYFLVDKSNMEPLPVVRSLGRTIRYHLGSIAFGSLLIAIVQFIRLMLKYIEQNLTALTGKSGWLHTIAEWLLWCMDCCFWCVEKFLKFISRNAYIVVAVYGKSFCAAAKDAFQLLMRNALTLTVLNIIGDFLLFLGKLIITFLTVIVAILWMRGNENLNYYAFPCLIVMILAYIIAAVFMSVFEMAIDTIFVCVCEDLERHSPEPRWMSDNLKPYAKPMSENRKSDSDSGSGGSKPNPIPTPGGPGS